MKNLVTPLGYDRLFDSFELALKADGTMWSWGNGGNGALGQNDNTNRSSPTQVGTISPTLYWTHLVQSGWTTIYGIKNDNT